MSRSETYPFVSVQGGKVHRPADPSRDRGQWFSPLVAICGRTVTPLNVYEDEKSATGGRDARLCSQCEARTVTIVETFRQGTVRETRTHVVGSLEPVALTPIVSASVGAYYLGQLAGDLSRDGRGQLGWSDFRVVEA